MMTLPYPYSSSARFYALRLLPGQEVLSQLRAFAQQQQLHAAWIAGCTGSLTDVALRYAGQENTALLSGKFEVIALNGTLEQSGEHLHLCVSDPHGPMLGGHRMSGCTEPVSYPTHTLPTNCLLNTPVVSEVLNKAANCIQVIE
ncbi:DNA-binding protein, partial [Escherichia coli]|nr:DNA-binding protein [Escherichia coli]